MCLFLKVRLSNWHSSHASSWGCQLPIKIPRILFAFAKWTATTTTSMLFRHMLVTLTVSETKQFWRSIVVARTVFAVVVVGRNVTRLHCNWFTNLSKWFCAKLWETFFVANLQTFQRRTSNLFFVAITWQHSWKIKNKILHF